MDIARLASTLAALLLSSTQFPAISADVATDRVGEGDSCVEESSRVSRTPWPIPAHNLAAARCLAANGNTEAAIQHVSEAVRHPMFRAAADLFADPGLSVLHQHRGWPDVVAEAERKSRLPEPVGAGVDVAHMRANLPSAPRMLGRGREARVVMLVWVSPEGRPAHIEIEQSSGIAAVDSVAAAAAATWRYTPAVTGEGECTCPMRLPLDFARR